jgi:DNA-binding transcriptional LysR family regulator
VEIYHLRSFVTIADAGGVSKAARLLHVAQPAVSQHLRSLEREVGSELFERTPRGMQLTDAGLSLLGRARDVLSTLADFKTAAETFSEEVRSQVKVAMTPSLAASLVPSVIETLGVSSSKVQLMLYERPTQDALGLLAVGAVEMAVVRDSEGSGFQVTPLLEEELHLVLARGHPLSQAVRNLGLGALKDEPFLFFRHTGREMLFQGAYAACLRAGFTPKAICEGAETATLGELVKRNLGVTIAPLSVIRLWEQDQIEVLPLDEPPPRSVAYLARVQDRLVTDQGAKVIRAITRAARQLSAELSGF